MSGSTHVCVSTRVDAETLLNSPEQVMQLLSIKVYQRRQQLLDEMTRTRVAYEYRGDTRYGVVERVDGKHVLVRDGADKYRVPLQHVRLLSKQRR